MTKMTRSYKIMVWLVLMLCVLQVASSAGFVFPLGDANPWYATLTDPSFAPPSWVFGLVCTTLYILIATSAYRVVATLDHSWNKWIPLAVGLWALQLSDLGAAGFAGAQNLEVALYYIVMLWVSIAAYIFVSWKVDRIASLIMVPYLAWVSFATVLNYTTGN